MTAMGYPSQVARFAGRINDVDGHEWLPWNLWTEEFGEIARPMAETEKVIVDSMKDSKQGYLRNSLTDTPSELTPLAVWKTKGPNAIGAWDMRERLRVMDYTGVHRQLIFPGSMAIAACRLFAFAEDMSFYGSITGDRREYALKLLKAYNNWAVRNVNISDRLRIVATLVAPSPDELVAEAKQLIKAGVRAFWLPSAMPPGGKSPAHNDLDSFWSLLEDSDSVATLHLGDESAFLRTLEWRKAKAFEGWKVATEISADPWGMSTKSFATQNFLITMIGGAVFHRHPRLRVGAIELGAHWVGPLGHQMDMWADNTLSKRWSTEIPLKPSEYIRRHVRVSGFPFEEIDTYIRRFGLEEVYCYAGDYPHVEGGFDPMAFWADRLAGSGEAVAEKFFVTNGEFLLPN